MKAVSINGENLTIEAVIQVARNHAKVALTPKAKQQVQQSRQVLEQLIKEKKTIYGVTTGFGAFGNVSIPAESIRELQQNLIRSHSVGVGNPANTETVRAMMMLRANTLAKGYSGIRLETLETLIAMLNKGVHPIVPEQGSVGASGDLAPLSHMTLVLMGEGEAEYKGEKLSSKQALAKAGIKPVKLEAKEGVGFINGTQFMTAIAALTVYDAQALVASAEAAAALSLEALRSIADAFDSRIHAVRPHAGQIAAASHVRVLISGSKNILTGDKAAQARLYPQDAYSLRCIPQVLGCVRDAISYVKTVVETEANSATDNPLVFSQDKTCLSGGNFHGQPISLATDFLATALATVGNMSERRTARLIDENCSRGLPAFLVSNNEKRGVESGFMALQYTAAALASENKALAHPASVDSIPTSANFEDFVSMGPIAARKAEAILRNVERIVAIELLCAAQGADLRGANKLGTGTKTVYSLIRRRVPMLKKDRALTRDVEKIAEIMRNGQLAKAIKPFLES
jgi:histidine ammonia-lyase